MTPGTHLRGLSWDHPRGHWPMLATSAAFCARSEGSVTIEWVPRSLREFGVMPLEQLARSYDLMVVDHPHIGLLAQSGHILALDQILGREAVSELAERSPGGTHQSYQYDGHQWALAIDAACQTSAWRDDLLVAPPLTWGEVTEMAKEGRVLWPLGPVDAAASFMTMTAMAGAPCTATGTGFTDPEVAVWAFSTMAEVAAHSDSRCLRDDPITVLEAMTGGDQFVYSPLLFCYAYYCRPGNGPATVTFGPPPGQHEGQPATGPVLGGAGLAVSALAADPVTAASYILYVASASTQTGAYFAAGGQPAHGAAWHDPQLDKLSGHFFSSVLPSLERSWTRPRHPAFAVWQDRMFELFNDWYVSFSEDPRHFIEVLEQEYRHSLREAPL